MERFALLLGIGMKVYRSKVKYTGHAPSLHGVEQFRWERERGKLALHLLFWCSETAVYGQGDTYELYEKDIHRKKLCKGCVSMLRLNAKKHGK